VLENYIGNATASHSIQQFPKALVIVLALVLEDYIEEDIANTTASHSIQQFPKALVIVPALVLKHNYIEEDIIGNTTPSHSIDEFPKALVIVRDNRKSPDGLYEQSEVRSFSYRENLPSDRIQVVTTRGASPMDLFSLILSGHAI